MRLKSKKVLGVFLSVAVALYVVVPGTLAAEVGADVSDNPIFIGEETEQESENVATSSNASGPSIDDETLVESEDVVEGDTSTEVATPSDAEECTCGSEDGIHTAECPLYEAPVESKTQAHMDGCSDECDGTDCKCECHRSSLFERLMACETYEELWLMIEDTPEEELMVLTEEQVAQVEEKSLALEPQPLPEVIIEESNDEPVVSEIIYPTVNFTNVAPFGDPIVG